MLRGGSACFLQRIAWQLSHKSDPSGPLVHALRARVGILLLIIDPPGNYIFINIYYSPIPRVSTISP